MGRISPSGVITNYTDASIDDPKGIAAGSAGALWFTNLRGNSIGRITTAGVVSSFTDPSIDRPLGITAGPDGALWFYQLWLSRPWEPSIGRITTAGVISHFTGPSVVDPHQITAGPRWGVVVYGPRDLMRFERGHLRRCRDQLHRCLHGRPTRDYDRPGRGVVVHQ